MNKEDARLYYYNGYSVAYISRKAKVSRETIYQWCKEVYQRQIDHEILYYRLVQKNFHGELKGLFTVRGIHQLLGYDIRLLTAALQKLVQTKRVQYKKDLYCLDEYVAQQNYDILSEKWADGSLPDYY